MNKQGVHFLIAEDEYNDAFFLVRALQKQFPEMSVYVAKDGSEAIRYLAGQDMFADREKFRNPDVVITDLKMPRVSGLDFLLWMQNHPEYRVNPCFMLSSSTEEQDRNNATRLGVNAYLAKPSALDGWQKVAATIQEHYEHQPKPARPPQEGSLNAAKALPATDGMRQRVKIEVGAAQKQTFGCDIVFPTGVTFHINGQDVTSRFQSHQETRLVEVYEGEVGTEDPLPIRVERENRGPRHCKLRVLSRGRLLYASHIRRCRTTRESISELLMPGLFVVLIAYYAIVHDPGVCKFYSDKIIHSDPTKYRKGTLPPQRHVQASPALADAAAL